MFYLRRLMSFKLDLCQWGKVAKKLKIRKMASKLLPL